MTREYCTFGGHWASDTTVTGIQWKESDGYEHIGGPFHICDACKANVASMEEFARFTPNTTDNYPNEPLYECEPDESPEPESSPAMADVQITRDGDIFACEYNGLELQAGIYGHNGAYHIAAHVSGPYPNAVYGHCLPDSKPYARKGNAERAVARYIRDNAPALPEPDNTPEPDVTGHIQEPESSPYSDESEHGQVITCEQCGQHTAQWTYDFKVSGSPAYHFFYTCQRDECGHTTFRIYERAPNTTPEPDNTPDKENADMTEPDYNDAYHTCVACGTPATIGYWRASMQDYCKQCFWATCPDCGKEQQIDFPEPEPKAYRDGDGRILCPHCLYSFHGWNGTRECDALTTVQPGTICARCRKPLGEPEKTGDCGTPEQGEPDNTRIGADGKTPANKACFDCGRAIGYEAFSVITGKHKDIQPGDIILCEPCAIARDERAQGPTVTPELAVNLASRINELIGWHEDTLKIQADKLSDYANRHAFGLSGDELADHNQQIEVCRMLARILRIARLAEYKPNR